MLYFVNLHAIYLDVFKEVIFNDSRIKLVSQLHYALVISYDLLMLI